MQFAGGFVVGVIVCTISMIKAENECMRRAYREGYRKALEDGDKMHGRRRKDEIQ